MSNSVIFKTLRGANFFRFGNEEFVFNFTKGVIGLMGENGLGKSSILDAVCICLFNETYRKINQEDWTNNINGKGLYLSVLLETRGANVDEYLIMRKPTARKSADKLKIFKNGVELNGIVNYQEYIENTILGFGANVFKNAIAVSGGTPFISMTPDEKRKFSDNLFSIKQVQSYKKKANERLSELQVSKRIIEQEIAGAKNKIVEFQNVINIGVVSTESQIAEIQNDILNSNDGMAKAKAQIDQNNIDIGIYNEKIRNSGLRVSSLEQDLVTLNADSINIEIGRVKAELDNCKKEYKNEITEMNRISPNVVCLHCGNSYTVEQANEHKEKHRLISLEIAENGKRARAKFDELMAQTPRIDEIRAEINRIKYEEINSFRNAINQLENSNSQNASYISSLELAIFRYNSRIEALKVQNDTTNVVAFAKKSIDESNTLIANKESELVNVVKRINALNYIVKMCSDAGIKHLLLKQFMPILNKLIAYYLDKFDLPVVITFDEYFGHTMSAPKGLGAKHGAMSKGQKTRINLAILFAVVELIKSMGNVNCNLLMLDEFADEGLDSKGFAAAVRTIRSVADKDDKSIVLITHKQEDVLYDNLNALYEVELKNSFSVLKEVSSF